jgi:hypothetical protein
MEGDGYFWRGCARLQYCGNFRLETANERGRTSSTITGAAEQQVSWFGHEKGGNVMYIGKFTDTSKLVFVIASVSLGLLLMFGMLVILIVAHPVPPEAAQAARTLLSMGAGLAAAGLVGSLKFDGNVKGVGITAGGGFGVFIIVYLFEPGVVSMIGLS